VTTATIAATAAASQSEGFGRALALAALLLLATTLIALEAVSLSEGPSARRLRRGGSAIVAPLLAVFALIVALRLGAGQLLG
jgi:hypothetical protein